MGVFFQPPTATSVIEATAEGLRADSTIGLIGFIDQAAGYQEFRAIFEGTSTESALTEQQIPPSLRVLSSAVDATELVQRLREMPGVLRVAEGTVGQASDAPELNGVAGRYAIGTVLYQAPSWRHACALQAWPLDYPRPT